MNNVYEEIRGDIITDLKIEGNGEMKTLDKLVDAESKYVKDLRVNLKNALKSKNLSRKEAYLIALSVAVNEKNDALISGFEELAREEGATDEEIAETYSCASLLAVNNVFYRFRHFADKESYQKMPARIKMSIMMKPVLGREFFELMSLVISAVNGCEQCVKSHEASVLEAGASEERVFDAIKLGSVVRGTSQIIR